MMDPLKRRGWRRFFHRARWDGERASEIDAYIEIETAENTARGIPAGEARLAALRKFGNVTLVREEIYRMNTIGFLETLGKDLLYAVRMLRKSPGFAAVAVTSLALGIGANTALFSLVDSLLLRSLPVPHPEQLVQLGLQNAGTPPRLSFSYPVFEQLRDDNQVFSGIFAMLGNEQAPIELDGRQERANVDPVSGAFFSVLGAEPLLGRTFTAAEDRQGAEALAVMSYGYWQRRFALDPGVLGKKLIYRGVAYSVVGVAPQGFSGVEVDSATDLWLPITTTRAARLFFGPEAHSFWSTRVVARTRAGLNASQVLAGINVRLAQILESENAIRRVKDTQHRLSEADFNRFAARQMTILPAGAGTSWLRQQYTEPLFILMGVVGLVLLIACANIANLLMARATGRRREIAVRLAIGAGTSRLFRQLFTESMLLAAIGAAAGVLFAGWAGRTLVSMVLHGGDSPIRFHLDLHVLGFTAAVTVFTGILFGVGPSWRAVRLSVNPALKNDAGAEGGQRGLRFPAGQLLVVCQVALSLVLLVGAALFVGTLQKLLRQDIGFQRESIVLAQFFIGQGGPVGPPRLTAYNSLLERAAAIPGVRSAALSDLAVFGQSSVSDNVYVQGRATSQTRNANFLQVSPGFFETMGIPVLQGRQFTARDDSSSPKVAIVNETFAREFFSGESPIGKRFGFLPNGAADVEIAGLVKDIKWRSLRDSAPPFVFMPMLQPQTSPYGAAQHMGQATLTVRVAGDPAGAIAAVRREVRDAHVFGGLQIDTESHMIEQTLAQERLLAQLSGFFGALGLALAAVGLYGLMTYTVSRRTRELGVRVALGAQPTDLLRAVMGQTLTLVLIGAAAGCAAAFAAARLVSAFLFRITPSDPMVLASAMLTLTVVGVLATWLPARRASRVDPMTALRHE
jgi:predicted permease